jgi:hypothetical protein
MAKIPDHKPNDHTKGLVEGLAIAGMDNKIISQHLSISEATLKVHYKEQLAFGREGVKALGASALIKAVKEGNVTAIIFFCKTRLGFRETDRLEVTGADGQPIEYKKVGTPKFKELTVTEWREQFQHPSQQHLN